MIKAGLSTSIYYTHLDGFDTHSGQLQQHANLLRELGTSLKAFLDDLEKSGESERVVVLVFSEFGRRLGENGSGGTDHGTAAPVFLLGQPVKAGLHGPYPDLTRLEDGDPIHAVDFRRDLRDPARPVAGRPPPRRPRRGLRADAGAAGLMGLEVLCVCHRRGVWLTLGWRLNWFHSIEVRLKCALPRLGPKDMPPVLANRQFSVRHFSIETFLRW